MEYGLQKAVEMDGKQFDIRTDYRVILEIFQVLNDAELDDADKMECVLTMFYVHPEEITNYGLAVEKCFDFIDRGHRRNQKSPKLMDWQKDYEYIIAPVNRVLGYEARAVEYDFETNKGGLHWWTFLAAYMEIGNKCTLSSIIEIRDKLSKGKQLTKEEKAWYRRNIDVVKFETQYTESENALLKDWV